MLFRSEYQIEAYYGEHGPQAYVSGEINSEGRYSVAMELCLSFFCPIYSAVNARIPGLEEEDEWLEVSGVKLRIPARKGIYVLTMAEGKPSDEKSAIKSTKEMTLRMAFPVLDELHFLVDVEARTVEYKGHVNDDEPGVLRNWSIGFLYKF